MARHEHDREDLFTEATALVERFSLALAGELDEVVVGFRRDGSLGMYFGGDLAYHFNPSGHLRRAYCRGALLKAGGGRLTSMVRERTANEVVLRSRVLGAAETEAFMNELQRKIDSLRAALAGDAPPIGRVVPAEADVPVRALSWLRGLPSPIVVAASPRAR